MGNIVETSFGQRKAHPSLVNRLLCVSVMFTFPQQMADSTGGNTALTIS